MSTQLLESLVRMTRAIYGAAACSIMRHDRATGELVFEAVAGEGEATLIGRRIPAGTGLAGWALASEEPIAVSDVVQDPRFAREFAESTGYIPSRLAVYPLLHGEEVLGVLSLLDADGGGRIGLADMATLGMIAMHAADLLALVLAGRTPDAERGGEASAPRLAGIGAALDELEPGARAAAEAMLDGLEKFLRSAGGRELSP